MDSNAQLTTSDQESENELEFRYDHSLREPGNERLLEVWDQLNSTSDVPVLTAILLSGVHYYSHAITQSNVLNGLQGRNRATFHNEQKSLMNLSLEDNTDLVIDKQLNDLFIYICSTYISERMVLPVNKPKIANGMKLDVYSFIIMLFATGQYGVLSQIEIPDYAKKPIGEVFEFITDSQDKILDTWIEYLEGHESQELADLVRSMGRSFWGSEYSTAQNTFLTKFQNRLHKFKDYQGTYDAYLKFRESYIKVSRNIARNGLIGYFGMSNDQYNWHHNNVINELNNTFVEDESSLAIQKLIYGY